MAGTVATAIINKLKGSNHLDADDLAAIERLPARRKEFGPRQPIVLYGDKPQDCCVIIEGFVARSLTLPEGERQIVSLHMPGDIPDLQSLHTRVLDHDLRTFNGCTVGLIPHSALREITEKRPNVAAALWRESLMDAAIFRQWIVNVGRRDGLSRMAHLIAEMRFRMNAIGRAEESFRFPMTQTDLADCLGLSVVHTNRVLQQLRRQNVIQLHRDAFEILDIEALHEAGQFDSLYLRSPR